MRPVRPVRATFEREGAGVDGHRRSTWRPEPVPVAIQRACGASCRCGPCDAAAPLDRASVQTLQRLVGSTATARFVQRRPGDVPNRVIGDTPGTRTADETPGVKESRAGTPGWLDPLDRVACELEQTERIDDERDAHAAAGHRQPIAYYVEKLAYCRLSKCTPPSLLVSAIKEGQFRGQPQARKNLDWYVEGSGQDLEQPMEGGFLADPGVRKQLTDLIGAAKPRPGVALPLKDPVKQEHYENQEWRNALGNIDQLTVTIVGPGVQPGTGRVRVELRDPYQWHPGDERVTQCIHEYFESLKPTASEYMAVGTGEVDLPLDKSLIPSARVVPATPTSSPSVPSSAAPGADADH